jgi:hypothetical protein
MTTVGDDIHRQLAYWAADCAERVLPIFELAHPDDHRPRDAIEAARAWMRGDLPMIAARKAAFASHAAARDSRDARVQAAARAAGHAAATAHVATHAPHAASYALKAANDPTTERAWQESSRPRH